MVDLSIYQRLTPTINSSQCYPQSALGFANHGRVSKKTPVDRRALRPDQGHWVGMLRCLVPLYVNRGQAKPRVIFTIPSGILIDIIYIYITKYLLWSVKCWIILDNVNDKWYNMTIFSWACCFHVWPKNTGVPIPGGVPLEIWKT